MPSAASRVSVLFCVSLAAFAFAGTLDAFFTQDDFWLLAATDKPLPNQRMLSGALAPDYVRPLSTYWFPLACRSLFGLNASLHHLALLALLLATVYALHDCVRKRTGSLLAAAAAACLYATSEVHVYTLGWIAGIGDVLAAALLVFALRALETPPSRRRTATVALLVLGALLSKEHSMALPAALLAAGAARYGARLLRRRTDQLPGQPVRAPDHVLGISLAAVAAGFLSLWIYLTAESQLERGLQFNLSRTVEVLKNSILTLHPTLDVHDDYVTRLSSWWLAAPAALAGLHFRFGGVHRIEKTAFAFSLWLVPAGIFALTSFPSDLQAYYSHFSTIGLTLLVADCVALGASASLRPLRIATKLTLVAAIVAHGVYSAKARQTDVCESRSPALYVAKLSAAADLQIRAALADGRERPNRILFLDTENVMWWALGKGAMVQTLYGGIEADFDGYGGFQAAPNARSTGETLVMRQTNATTFVVVR
ncbi:MAG: hypothetical protein AB8H80_04330 [Planctomycetota bacterium]